MTKKRDVKTFTMTDDEGRELLVVSAPAAPTELPSVLSPAEREVVSLALLGLANEAIALSTGRAPRTVANLLARACAKLGVRRRTELAAAVARHARG